jgi:tetratricopeptide (TPR) repeat protein
VAAKVAAGESAEHAPRDFFETNSGEKQSQGRAPTDPHSTSSHQAQTIVNRLDEAEKKIKLALSLSQKGNYQEALKLYEEALKLAPNYSLAWYNQGIILFKLNRLKDALHSNQTAWAINNTAFCDVMRYSNNNERTNFLNVEGSLN